MPQNFSASAESAADDAVRAARNLRDGAGNVAYNFQTAVDKSVTDQPLTTLAIAVAMGFVLGALWKA